MQDSIFKTSAHAKCILAGEHAVLYGSPALVMPVKQKEIVLTFKSLNQPLTIITSKSNQDELNPIFEKALAHSLKPLNKKISEDVQGEFQLYNTITMGGGIGFSAALCLVITRWLIRKNWVHEKDLFSFACRLEDVYHGTSSGLDIVGAMSDHIVLFNQLKEISEIKTQWHPHLYLSYSGVKKETKEAVACVKKFAEDNPALAHVINQQMANSVNLIKMALEINKNKGLPLLISAIQQANDCFKQWGLITPILQQHLDTLNHLGALAVKPTGAGRGGYVISLWEKVPPQIAEIEWIAISI